MRVSFPNQTRRANQGSEFCLVVVGAHKVGSTWVHKMLNDLGVFRKWPVPAKYRSNKKNHGLIGLQNAGVEDYFRNTKGFRLYKSHSEPPDWLIADKVKFITVLRDPRDVVISNIFYLENLGKRSPQLGGWTELSNLPLKERIGLYLNKAVYDLELLEKWSEYDHVTKVFYEKLLDSTEACMQQAFEGLELVVSDSECSRIVAHNTFNRLSRGRSPGQENSHSFFRKGVAGDWKNYFGKEEIDLFKTEKNGRWNQLLVRLGYEDSYDWS